MPASETVPRDRICAAEIWCECFNKDISLMRRADAVEINSILDRLTGWKKRRAPGGSMESYTDTREDITEQFNWLIRLKH